MSTGFFSTVARGFAVIGQDLGTASPTIMTVAGVGLIFAAGVKAVIDTKHANEILDDQIKQIEHINENHTEEEMQLPEVKREIASTKIKTAGKLVWNYKWSLLMAGAGISLIFGSDHIMNTRLDKMTMKYTAAAAALNASQKAYDIAMERARTKYGEAAEKYLRHGTLEEIYEEEEVDEETGKKKKVKKTRDVAEDGYFAKGAPNLVVLDEQSLLYRECQGSLVHMRSQAQMYENVLNENYHSGCVITRNDIIKWLCGNDDPHLNDAGQILGYSKWDPENRKNNPKDCIDLGIFTFMGSDPETGEAKMYLAIDPNIPGPVSIDATHRKTGKYIAAA